MKSLQTAIWVEYLKICKSRVFWLSVVFFAFTPCMFSLLFFVQQYPDIASKLGMIGTKASMLRFGKADWPNYFNILNQGIAAISLIGFGFITSWVFRREYTERTLKDIIALPILRTYIVISKFVIIFVWSVILSIVFIGIGILCGIAIKIPDWSNGIILEYLNKFLIIALLSTLLFSPVAFLASFTNGYLLPIGFVILTMIMANFSGLVGLGPYFPWAIPGIYSLPSGTENMHLGLISYSILSITCILGVIATIAWWKYADQK